MDVSGDIYTAGTFVRKVDFDRGVGTFFLTSKSTYDPDIFTQKLDSSGNFLSGTVDFDRGAGTFFLTTVTNSVHAEDIFIQKLDASGNFIWSKSIGAKPGDEPFTYSNSIVLDNSGNVYTTGNFGNRRLRPGHGYFRFSDQPTYLGDVFVQTNGGSDHAIEREESSWRAGNRD